MINVFDWLQNWYFSQCDGDWEHIYGIKITTLDNPGWKVVIELSYTPLEGLNLPTKRIERSDNNWIHYSIQEDKFQGYCGPLNLTELIEAFQSLVSSHFPHTENEKSKDKANEK